MVNRHSPVGQQKQGISGKISTLAQGDAVTVTGSNDLGAAAAASCEQSGASASPVLPCCNPRGNVGVAAPCREPGHAGDAFPAWLTPVPAAP